jgi:Amt family ammonium transporter
MTALQSKVIVRTRLIVIAFIALWIFPKPAAAEVSLETQYILNTFSFLFHGMLVLFMSAGFSMLEAGVVRTKSVATILLKNITLIAIAAIAFYLTGYSLMFTEVNGGYFGTLTLWIGNDAAAVAGDYGSGAASASVFMFQMLFCVTAASIISGALAERIKLWPFFIFITLFAAFLYPVQGAWGWGGGWLAEMNFKDFAGGTHVHTAAGWAALTGAIVLGARRGRFGPDGKPRDLPASSLPLATLGTMFLWLGWLGFNGGSQGALGSASGPDHGAERRARGSR